MPRPLISVVFTCKNRPELTELCLRRLRELMPEPHELIIAYDGKDPFYENMLLEAGNPNFIIDGLSGKGRWELLNDAISCATETVSGESPRAAANSLSTAGSNTTGSVNGRKVVGTLLIGTRRVSFGT